jgi:hypothetical protein
MPRPELPVPGEGPVADLARELRRWRDLAGRPGYRELAAKAHFGATTLAEAAAGHARPAKGLTLAFARACGAGEEDLEAIEELWDEADRAQRVGRRAGQVNVDSRITVGIRGLRPPVRSRPTRAATPLAPLTAPPRPDARGTAEAYVRQLRALRAWAGQPGHKAIVRRAERALERVGLQPLPRSTMYDVFNPGRTALPALYAVRYIVAALNPAALGEWTSAWQDIKIREVISAPGDESPDNPEAAAVPASVAAMIRGVITR